MATTYAFLAVIAVVASVPYTANTITSGLHDRVVLDLADEARLLADQVSRPMTRDDIAAVDAYVARAESLTHARMLIVRTTGDVVAATHGWATADDDASLTDALAGQTIVNTAPTGGLFGGFDPVEVSVPVVAPDGSVVGALEVTYALDEVQAIVSRLNATSILVAAGAVLAPPKPTRRLASGWWSVWWGTRDD